MESTGQAFAAHHRWDRNFFLFMIGLIWLGVIMGFGPGVLKHFTGERQDNPLIVHLHAAVFVAWLALLTTQALLIRTNRRATHKKLGGGLALLAVVMIAIGPLAEVAIQVDRFGTPRSRPAFLAVSIFLMVAFAGLVGVALKRRADAALHKRLILMATIMIASAGYARWTGKWITEMIGRDHFWGNFTFLYLGVNVLFAIMVGYDLVTRRRLHPAMVAGLVWLLTIQLISVWLYFSPWWLRFCTTLIGH
ncbi:hypothetical protein Q4S45_08385 [Massilia sp. R2A-15]|uniref:hypothetical protein n=1 Tax=Massilia sp. R2A-15 TaxID=3064278 RepID=UPI002736DCFF|nr:hypothetical protein [Massilia sp. R2A-15]WLI91123.1 hypothetical protein Q4S45_08385 [Massilia sp. R2A-15]